MARMGPARETERGVGDQFLLPLEAALPGLNIHQIEVSKTAQRI
jgi:hypothetical protein